MKSGRKPFAFTAEAHQDVLQETAFGTTQKQLALKYGITQNTLRKHFGKELRDGKAWANKMVAKSLFWSATVGKNVTAAIWWEKTRAGMHEKLAHEHSLANAPPPPRLGISFEDGGPGRVRKTPVNLDHLENHGTVEVGQDYPSAETSPPTPAAPPVQEFLPRAEAAKPATTLDMWARLGQTPEQFNAQPVALEPIRCVGLAACPCDRCKNTRARFGHSHESNGRSQ
jgi:hypothetical protein